MSMRRVLQLTFAIVVGSALLALASPAGAVDNPDYSSPPPSTVVSTPAQANKKVTTAVRVTPVRTRLAITGTDATGTVVVAGSLITLGAGVLVVRRRLAAA